MFDVDTIYVSARCWDSAPPAQWTANEMRRDTNQLTQNDTFGMMFDTYYDRRDGFVFYANPLGAFSDRYVTDEGAADPDWNAVWAVRTGRFDGGWTIEIAVPFKTLRYKTGNPQTWGLQLRRAIRRKNEWTYLTTMPASVRGPQAMARISLAGTLVGVDAPSASKQLAIKPYAISRLTTDRAATLASSSDLGGDLGLDVKYGVTPNLTADFTSNTDFGQVEDDEQQVNLTRFSLFFPEKRDFFLEARSTFDFGSAAGGIAARDPDVPALFYSRRIGLNRGRVIPIDAGGQLTGNVGKVRLGLLNIQAGDESVSGTPSTNFTALRVKRNILRRSFVGAMFTNRSQSTIAEGANHAFDVDAAFAFFTNLTMGGYYAETQTPGRHDDAASYQARSNFDADRYGAQVEYLHVGNHFNPEVGFVRRTNFDRTSGVLRFSPRPKRNKWVRTFTTEALLDYIENGAGALETREETGRFNLEPSLSINLVDLPTGSFTTQVLRTRADFGFSPRTFASALVQYGSGDNTFSSNLRFRWEYQPGSEFFAVYTDERDTLPRGFPQLRNRAFVLKITRLLQFSAGDSPCR